MIIQILNWFKGLRKYRKINIINDTQTSTGPFLKCVGWNNPSKPLADGLIKLQKRTDGGKDVFFLFYAANRQYNTDSKTKKKKIAGIPSEFLHAFLDPGFLVIETSGFQSIAGVRIPRAKIWDRYTFLGNCPPTPPLSQHFSQSEE